MAHHLFKRSTRRLRSAGFLMFYNDIKESLKDRIPQAYFYGLFNFTNTQFFNNLGHRSIQALF